MDAINPLQATLLPPRQLPSGAGEGLFTELIKPLTHDREFFQQSHQSIICRIVHSVHGSEYILERNRQLWLVIDWLIE